MVMVGDVSLVFSGLVLPAAAGDAHPLPQLVAGTHVLQVVVVAVCGAAVPRPARAAPPSGSAKAAAAAAWAPLRVGCSLCLPKPAHHVCCQKLYFVMVRLCCHVLPPMCDKPSLNFVAQEESRWWWWWHMCVVNDEAQ